MALIQLLIVAWLPGAVIFRLPLAERDKRAALDAEERLFWAVIISLAVSLSIVVALAAAHRYSFGRLIVADVAVAALTAAAARFRLRLGPSARRPGLTALLPLTLVILGLLHFFPPSEYIMGGKDPGTYISEGIQIAQRGAIVVDDPVVASVPAFARELFFPVSWHAGVYSVRFMGFFIRNPDTGATVGQFPHLFPASIAIGYGLDGLTGARRAVSVWATLGLLAVYFAGARLIGRTAAWAAAALLALHVIQVWFGRYPNAEVVMQTLLFAALLANAHAHVDDDGFFAPVAGALLGLLLFLRIDAVLGIAGVMAGVALGVLAGGRVRPMFLAALAITSGIAVVYLIGPMRVYSDLPIIFFTSLSVEHYLLLSVAVLLTLGALAGGARLPLLGAFIRRVVPTALTLALIGAAVYALYFRQPDLTTLAARDAYALRTFVQFYLTLPGLLAALVGFALVARRSFWRDPALFLTVASFSCFFFYKIRIVSDHFWMARRFLPVILPGALLFAAAAALGARGGPGIASHVAGGNRRHLHRAAGGAVRAGHAPDLTSRRVCRPDSPAGEAGRIHRRQGSADCRVTQRLGHACPGVAACLHICPQRAGAGEPASGQGDLRHFSRVGPHTVRSRVVHGRRRNRSAVARLGRNASHQRAVSDPRGTMRQSMHIRASCARRSSTTACMRSRRRIRTNRTARSIWTSDIATTCTSFDSTPRKCPKATRSGGPGILRMFP